MRMARNYARAFFIELAGANIADTAREPIQGLINLLRELPGLPGFLAVPFVPDERKHNLIDTLAVELQLPPVIKRFLSFAVKKRIGALLPVVLEELVMDCYHHSRILLVSVRVPALLSDSQKTKIEAYLLNRLPYKGVVFEQTVQPGLLGFSLHTSDGQGIDWTVDKKMRRLRTTLLTP